MDKTEKTQARAARKLLKVIQQLHDLGYEGLRVMPAFGTTNSWRCSIHYADHFEEDNGAVLRSDSYPSAAHYSSASGSNYFGWGDCSRTPDRELAQRFIWEFTSIARRGYRRDPKYANWYRTMLKRTEPYGLIYAAADYPSMPDGIGVCNTNKSVRIPLPPPVVPATNLSHIFLRTGSQLVQSSPRLEVSIYSISFAPWNGPKPADSYGGKLFLNVEGECLFAELAILRILQKYGWNGAWIDTFSKKIRSSMNESTTLPEHIANLLSRIKTVGNTQGGCFDLLAWKDDKLLFLEAKRKGKDRFSESQARFVAAAIACGLDCRDFFIVEWDLAAD